MLLLKVLHTANEVSIAVDRSEASFSEHTGRIAGRQIAKRGGAQI
jgi:hypothetical protein